MSNRRSTTRRIGTIVAIGELLWDEFPDGRRPGGAPGNVAYHAAVLGHRAVIVSRVGQDPEGEDLIRFLEQAGVDTRFVERDETKPTGRVAVSLDASGAPTYEIARDVAWDHLRAPPPVHELVRGADVICVGSLAQRSPGSRRAIQDLLSSARGQATIVFDVNLRPPFVDAQVLDTTLRRADVVKMGASEVEAVENALGWPDVVSWLLQDTSVRSVFVTRGGEGATVVTRDGSTFRPAMTVDVNAGDAVGAGDAFTAALAHALLTGGTARSALDTAIRYSALVATKRGGMPPVTPDDLAGIGL